LFSIKKSSINTKLAQRKDDKVDYLKTTAKKYKQREITSRAGNMRT